MITEYNEEIASVQTIVQSIHKGKYATHNIKYFCYLPEANQQGEIINADPTATLIIVTEHKLLYLKIDKDGSKKGKPQILFKINLRKVKTCEVLQASAGNIRTEPVFMLVISCYTVMKGLFK